MTQMGKSPGKRAGIKFEYFGKALGKAMATAPPDAISLLPIHVAYID